MRFFQKKVVSLRVIPEHNIAKYHKTNEKSSFCFPMLVDKCCRHGTVKRQTNIASTDVDQ